MNLKTAQLALLLGLTTRRVNQLAEDGVVVRVGHGEFDGAASIQNYIAQVSNRAKDKEADLDEAREAARLKSEQADNWELRNAKLRNELLPIDDVMRVWSEQIASIRSGLLAVVSRVRQRTSLSVEDAVVLDEEIRDAMTKLADGVEIYDVDPDADGGDAEDGDGDTAPTAKNQSIRMDGKGNKTAGNSVGGAGEDQALPISEGDS